MDIQAPNPVQSIEAKAREVFLLAIEQHSPESARLVVEYACGSDVALRSAVQRLLDSHMELGEFVEAEQPPAQFHVSIEFSPGQSIGPYKLRERIGEGGMGEVFVAQQAEPVRRKVALKIIRPGMATRDVVARFEAERQALAMMDHPNIARVFDGGVTDTGQPYFVMELVQGVPITEYCDGVGPVRRTGPGTGCQSSNSRDVEPSARRASESARRGSPGTDRQVGPAGTADLRSPDPEHAPSTHGNVHSSAEVRFGEADLPGKAGLPIRDRLELFLKVCRAVHDAHQKGIIHRDLKPSNILVAEIDGAAIPKIIDFGVAKAIDQKLTEQTVYTHFSQLVGTPLYMSPEQAGLGVVDIDTRSDVYSLGVLLYELLTGTTPFDSDSLKVAGFDEMRRIIREDEPPRPSARLSTLNAKAQSTVAERRGGDARQLGDSLKGELDWIVMTALEKDRSRRYDSASALAEDIERHLRDEPIEARPASRWYRAQKFVRRNRVLVASLTAVIAALSLGAALATAGLLHALDQRNLSRQAEEDAQAAKKSAEQRAEELAAALEDQREMTAVLGDMQPTTFLRSMRGRNRTVRDSIEEITRQIDEEGRLSGHPRVEIEVRSIFADAYFDVGEYEKFRDHLDKALVLAKQEYGDSLIVARIHARLAYSAGAGRSRIKDPTSTLEHANEAIRIYKLHGAVPDRVYVGMAYSLRVWPERHKEAIAAAQEAVRIDSEEAVYTVSDEGNIWMLMGDADSLDRALECFDLALENYRKLQNPQNHLEANLLAKKARCLRRRDELEPARDTFQAAYDLYETADLRSEPEGHGTGLSLADLHFAMGDVDQAFELVDEVEANAQEFNVASSQIQALDLRGWLYFQLGDFERAKPLLQEAERLAVAEYDAMDGRFALPSMQLALMYEAMGQTEEATKQYRKLKPLTQHFIDEPLVHALAYWLHARGILAAHDDEALRADDAFLLDQAVRIANEGHEHVKAWRQPNQEAAFLLLKAMIHLRRAADQDKQDQLDAAIRLLEEGLAKAEEPSATLRNERTYIVPADRWQLESKLVDLLVKAERPYEAHDFMEKAVSLRSDAPHLGPEHIQTILAEIRLGEFRHRLEQHDIHTAKELEDTFDKLRPFSPVVNGVRRRLAKLLIDAYVSLESAADAAKWRAELERLEDAASVTNQASQDATDRRDPPSIECGWITDWQVMLSSE